MSRFAIVIPARWGSTRFPGKPLHLIAGKPLIQHVWERCRRVKNAESVIIATDDQRIQKSANSFGAEVCLTSSKHQSGTDRVAEVAAKLSQISHIINVQGDEPLIDPRLIERLSSRMIDAHLPMITAANVFGKNDDPSDPNVVKVVLDADQNALYFSRSCIPFDRDETWRKLPACDPRDATRRVRRYRHQGIYGYSKSFLLKFVKWKPTTLEKIEQLEQLRALEHGVKIRVVLTKFNSIGVDTPADAEALGAILARR
jgi:3-deoxy-manno-octulosonate cytidylyltransferase (CMP-KDO synthetase)